MLGSAEPGEHLIGEDEGERDRDQRLAELLALVPAQEDEIEGEADEADDERRGDDADAPAHDVVALELECGIGAQQVERAVGHVDDSHEAEDEREAARDDEVEAREGEPGERHLDPDGNVALDPEAVAECAVGDPREREGQHGNAERRGDGAAESNRRESPLHGPERNTPFSPFQTSFRQGSKIAGVRRRAAVFAAVSVVVAAAAIVPLLLLRDDEGSRLTKQEYARRVTAIYAAVSTELGRPIPDRRSKTISAGLRRATASLDRAADELATLRPPADAEADHGALVDSTRDYARQVALVRASVDFGDVGTVLAHLRGVTAPAAIASTIRDLGRKGYRIPVRVRALR